MELLVLGGALLAGLLLGAAAVLLVRRLRTRRVVAHEVVLDEDDEDAGDAAVPVWEMDEAPYSIAAPPPRPPARAAPPPSPPRAPSPPPYRPRTAPVRPAPMPPRREIPSEWARRQVGPAEPGRTKGVCSGCGTMLSVSTERPLNIVCPVCGRTRLLS